MGKRNSEERTEGTIKKLKLDQTFETKNGKEFEAHLLVIEDSDDETHTFKVSLKSKAAKFVEKLKVGQKVAVVTGGDFGSVQAVFTDRPAGGAKGQTRTFDPTGPIQGMVLGAAVNKASAHTVEAIIEAAKIVLAAKKEVDQLVIKALANSKVKDEDESEDASDDEDEAPKKKKRKSKDADEDQDEDQDEDSPY